MADSSFSSEEPPLRDEISALFVESVFDSQERDFVPEGSLERLITQKSIVEEMRIKAGEEDGLELVDYVLGDGRKLFATAVYVGLTRKKLRQAMDAFRKGGYTNRDLPTLQEEDIIEQPHLEPKAWRATQIKEFLKFRWNFLVPVFAAENIDLQAPHILPFTEKQGVVKGGAFSQVFKVAIHNKHLRNAPAQVR